MSPSPFKAIRQDLQTGIVVVMEDIECGLIPSVIVLKLDGLKPDEVDDDLSGLRLGIDGEKQWSTKAAQVRDGLQPVVSFAHFIGLQIRSMR